MMAVQRSVKKVQSKKIVKNEKSFNPIVDFFVYLGFSVETARILCYVVIVIMLYLFIGFMAGDWV